MVITKGHWVGAGGLVSLKFFFDAVQWLQKSNTDD